MGDPGDQAPLLLIHMCYELPSRWMDEWCLQESPYTGTCPQAPVAPCTTHPHLTDPSRHHLSISL